MLRVQTGLAALQDRSFAPLRGRRVGLLAHPASVDASCRHIVSLMGAAGIDLRLLFGPEHGLSGAAQDMAPVKVFGADRKGPRRVSLYGDSQESLRPTADQLAEVDVLVVDLQDVGARYYTYAATMGYAMEVAVEAGVSVLVLDRPNPLGGRAEDVEGPMLKDGFHSFVGDYKVATRHGLTIGEYARWVVRERGLDLDLEIIPMEGWRREMDFEATGLPWVMPSPNMPTVDTAWIYPGQCLLEGTNLSEGRGTTRPFELCGAPFLSGEEWALVAQAHVGPGVILRPTEILPTHQKHVGQHCGAVQVHVSDRWAVRSLRLAVALIWSARKLAPERFQWRSEVYEFVEDRLAIDLLFGSAGPREALEAGAGVDDVVESFRSEAEAFEEARRGVLLY